MGGTVYSKLPEGRHQKQDIIILDGVSSDLFQPYFLLLSTLFVIASTIYTYVPFYTNVLYAILPYEIWQVIGIGQYVIPAVILLKIHAAPKSWFLHFYPIFVYGWIPITVLGFLHRHEHVWAIRFIRGNQFQ